VSLALSFFVMLQITEFIQLLYVQYINNQMDKQSKLIFENYLKVRNNVLNELAPVEMGEYGGTGEDITASFPEQSRGKYDLTPEETATVFKQFLMQFKSQGGKSPKLYKDFYEMEMAPVIRQIKSSINNTNAKYTARVLYNAMKEANVVKDERDGVQGIKMSKKVSDKGAENLAKYTIKNAGALGKEDAAATEAGAGIDDPIMKRFWEKILGEGPYQKEELARMMIEDNPDLEESESRLNISALIRSGYIKKTDQGYEAIDPEEQTDGEEKEGEGSGEITTGYDPEEVEDFDKEPYGGVYVGKSRGEIDWD
jgi:hypothetical protein